MSLLLARNRSASRLRQCPLVGADRKSPAHGQKGAFDPIATSGLVSTSSAGLNRDARKRDEGFDRWAAACCTRQCILKGRGLMSTEAPSQVLYFYNRHPISRSIILETLRSARGHLDTISPEEITRHDQDPSGRTPATDDLAH